MSHSAPETNTPDLWAHLLPRPSATDNKYTRGHTVILASSEYTGATRLAAEACSRIGSGLVTVLNEDKPDLFRTVLPADIMVKSGGLEQVNRPNVLLAGPGGCTAHQAKLIKSSNPDLKLVLDADAIRLVGHGDLAHPTQIITPHEGEFERYIGTIKGDRMKDACSAAEHLGLIVVLKGAKTIIAASDNRCRVNLEASPYLAKAGTGDVLAGMIAGLCAQGMAAFDACSSAVWLHGMAAQRFGPGLIPQDIIAELPFLLDELLD